MSIDAKKQYTVRLAERAEAFGRKLFPGRDYEMRGDLVIALGSKVESAELVPAPSE